MSTTPPATIVDERIARVNPFRQLLSRPELGAVTGAVAVWVFFVIFAGARGFLTSRGTASYLEVSAELGILAAAVALLMIGGEFDLSVGSVIGSSSIIVALLGGFYGWNIWAAIAVAFAVALLIGMLNGALVLRTGLPSFIVTLGVLFMVRGATIGFTRIVTGRTQVGNLNQAPAYDGAHTIFSSDVSVAGAGFSISILWWVLVVALCSYILLRTPFGNWIFGVGGNFQASRNVGVPVARVKMLLFMGTAAAACLVGVIQTVNFSGADVLRGSDREFYAIIAAVIGGNLLTGGYGSVVGAAFGALIVGMIQQGVVYAGIDADWVQFFLGGMLLAAVLINRAIRARAMGGGS